MKLWLALTLLLAPASLARAVDLYGTGANPWLDREKSREELLPAIELGAGYLVRNQLPSGQFVYLQDPHGKCCKDKGDRYSLIRHLGAVYALLRAYEVAKDAELLQAARRGIDFAAAFRDGTKEPHVVKGLKGSVNIGENGFLLLDATLYDELAGGDTYAVMTKELAGFVKGALVYGGPYKTKGEWAECQALMGLVRYERTRGGDPERLAVARKWLDAMAKAGGNSHWSVQAVQWLEAAAPAKDGELADYALAGGRLLLEGVLTRESEDAAKKPRFVGARSGKLTSCASTARNEGLIACHLLAKARGRAEDAQYFRERAREHLAYAMQFQYGQPHNLYPAESAFARVGRLFDLRGGVYNDPRTGYVRIDYVAHHVRALTAYLAAGLAPPGAGLRMDELGH